MAPPRIVAISAAAGLDQTGIVGGTLATPLTILALDQGGNPVSGAVINWQVITGGGVVTPAQSVSGPDGRASTSFRLGGLVGAQAAKATLSSTQSVQFTATATPAPASQILIVSGNNQSAPVSTALPQPLVVRVLDPFGNPKAGVNVLFGVLAGGGSLSTTSVLSNDAGQANVNWTLGPIGGVQQVAASAIGVPPVAFAANAQSSSAVSLAVVGGNSQTAPPGAPLPDSLFVKALDQFGNPVANVTVTWAPVGDAGSVSPVTSKTNAAGRAATQWTLGGTGGPKTVRATAPGLQPAEFQAAGTIVFTMASAGDRHSCGVDENGAIYCWGISSDGQLGIGTPPAGNGVLDGPQRVSVAQTFGFVGAGGFHSCSLTLSLNALCWGKNSDGRVGNNSWTQVNTPAAVHGTNVYSRISSGGSHTCALTTGGRVWCWGNNAEGQVGRMPHPLPPDSTAFNRPRPVLSEIMFLSVAAGGLHSCAIRTDGRALCWGHNSDGQLGDGTHVRAGTPVETGGVTLFASIVAGGRHTCGLTAGGAAWCWGDNQYGQLGSGTGIDAVFPTPVSGGLAFASLSAGTEHTCGVTTGGVAYCWGRNQHGQLGNGTTSNKLTPSPVGGGYAFASVSAGGGHTCGVTTGRVARCWGDNQFGQLGDESQVGSTLPVRVAFQP